MDANCLTQLEKIYFSHGKNSEWTYEKDIIQVIISQIEIKIKDRYRIIKPINIGGTAIVFLVEDNNLNSYQVLKFPRPIQGNEELITHILDSEIERLRDASHENIIALNYKGQVATDDTKWPFYVMEYIEGAQDAWEFIQENHPGHKWITRLIKKTANGLMFLHNKNTLHGDIKLENILVSPSGQIKISDLGSARKINPTDVNTTTLTFTKQYAHPDLLQIAHDTKGTDPNRIKAQIERKMMRKEFDIYALGKNIIRIIKLYDIADKEKMPTYERNYIQLMACRMLDNRNEPDETCLDIPLSIYKHICYTNTKAISTDIEKITGEYSIEKNIPELDHHHKNTIQISHPKSTAFTERVSTILSTPFFRRLSSTTQLGLVSQIYPTATHSRFEHSLGTFSNAARYCDALWHDKFNPLFKQVVTEENIKSLLIAALCHDIGQYPLAHDLEEADSDIFSHKSISKTIISELSKKGKNSLESILINEWGITTDSVIEILECDPNNLSLCPVTRLLHSIIDGPIDADKIDYLIRDSRNLNLQYGNSIDYERLLGCLTVFYQQSTKRDLRISIGVHEKGKIPAETIAFTRYSLFGSVYWHHTVRSAKSMLHRAVWEALPVNTDRRSSEYLKFKNEFTDNILSQCGAGTTKQLPLLTEAEDKEALFDAPQLSQTDFSMIKWISERTTQHSQQLLGMICQRQLYKRLLVISHTKNRHLWDKITDFKKNSRWTQMIKFQNEIQKQLVKRIKEKEEPELHSILVSEEYTEGIVDRDRRGEILFLVDIPTDRKGSMTDLEILPEYRLSGNLLHREDNVTLEESILWRDLTKDFLKSIGKIRVFCHPEIVDTCNMYFSRPEIEGIIIQACDIMRQ